MKIEIQSVDREQFRCDEHLLNGELVYLIQPCSIGCKWRQDNKHFRSSVWNADGELISAGFPKFTNFGEKPEEFPVPTNLKGSVITNKLDGSLLIVSKYKGQFILRTRGTIDGSKLDNGYELDIFKDRYISILDKYWNNIDTWPVSFLFEWLTGSIDHTIVLKYENVPDWIFIGGIDHHDYSLWNQEILNDFANKQGFIRPELFPFDDINELLNDVTRWTNKEGVVLYTNHGQVLHKIKSDFYTKLHRFKSQATLENTIDLFIQYGMPSYVDFEKKLVEQFDYECLLLVKGYISRICDAFKETEKIVGGMYNFISPLIKLPRKDAAQKIIGSYSTTNRASFCFQLLDGKTLSGDAYKKLLFQVLK